MTAAKRYFVDVDRWGNRWIYTAHWMLRCDVARRLGNLPHNRGLGVWQGGERLGDIGSGIGHGAPAQKVLRAMTKTTPIRVHLRPDLDDYLTDDDRPVNVYERPDGRLVYLNADILRASFGRLLSAHTTYQFDNSPSMRGLTAIVAIIKGQPAALAMPIRMRSPRRGGGHLAQQSEEAAA